MRVRWDKDVLQGFTQSVYWNTPRQWLCCSVPVRMNGACHMPMASPLALHMLNLLVHAVALALSLSLRLSVMWWHLECDDAIGVCPGTHFHALSLLLPTQGRRPPRSLTQMTCAAYATRPCPSILACRSAMSRAARCPVPPTRLHRGQYAARYMSIG